VLKFPESSRVSWPWWWLCVWEATSSPILFFWNVPWGSSLCGRCVWCRSCILGGKWSVHNPSSLICPPTYTSAGRALVSSPQGLCIGSQWPALQTSLKCHHECAASRCWSPRSEISAGHEASLPYKSVFWHHPAGFGDTAELFFFFFSFLFCLICFSSSREKTHMWSAGDLWVLKTSSALFWRVGLSLDRELSLSRSLFLWYNPQRIQFLCSMVISNLHRIGLGEQRGWLSLGCCHGNPRTRDNHWESGFRRSMRLKGFCASANENFSWRVEGRCCRAVTVHLLTQWLNLLPSPLVIFETMRNDFWSKCIL